MTTQPQYRVQLRDHTLQPLGELTDFLDGDCVLAFNDVGHFVFTVRAKDNPMAANFAAGNGIIVSRDRGDGSGAQTILSGPIWHLERHGKDDTYVLSGPTDEWWLKARRADPVTTYPYSAYILSLPGILRYYRLGEASGATATDASGHANGTYTGGVTYGQTPGIDDSDTAVSLNGTTGYVSVPTTSLPTGNGAFTLGIWRNFTSNPASTEVFIWLGTPSTSSAAYIGIGTDAKPILYLLGVGHPAPSALTAGWHHIGGTYDGTTGTLYVDGVSVLTVTPGTCTLAYGSASIGCLGPGTSNFVSGLVDEPLIGSTALTGAQMASIYAIGASRYGYAAYDTRTGTCSTVLRGYVNANAGAGALSQRQVSGLTLAADPAIGTSVTGNARFDTLLTLLQQLAISGGDIGFRLVQTDNGVLTFTIYQPATRSNAIFSRDLGNLLDFVYTLDGPSANQDVAAGGGNLTARVFAMDNDATSINTWGRVEGFVDARDTTDIPTMHQRNSADLAQNKQKTNLSITPQDTPALQYGRDYNLGDVVNVEIDGTTITDTIRQVHIQLTSTNQELVTPGIGNAGSGQVAWLFDAKKRALDAVHAQLRRLQAAQ